MGRNARKRISYVLPLAESTAGHRLGVNGLAVDSNHSILYTGGRDGVICAWNLDLDLGSGHQSSVSTTGEQKAKPKPTTLRQQVQAHTHWINDIVLAQNNEALISASSDISVKLWRPAATDAMPPQTIGLHSDYVKVLASPGPHAGWVASGGLDRKICLWDLNGTGQQSQIIVGEDPKTEKGSVYALAVTDSLVAAGGPESVVRIWDPRSGKRITNFVGHTDNVRDILINQDGDTIMTASSDQTVKVWSMTAGRCMYTLTMHNDSVWSLYSDHPQLSIFYSSDRSGLVAKTDVRNCADMDEGISVAVCQEHEGVNKVVNAGNYIWTSTSSSSINRWNDVDTDAEVALSDSYRLHRSSIATTRSTRYSSPPTSQSPPPARSGSEKLPMRALLRISNTAPYPIYQTKDSDSALGAVPMVRKPSDIMVDHEPTQVTPVRSLPDFTIEGQNGLIKHVLLNDRRRVLTLDTAGEVILWDLLQCAPIKSFGKRHLEDVSPEVNTTEAVAHWCAVDTRTGSLTCVLEENYCFDAEMYADELKLEENIEFREDQRINLGKWILRYLFSNLIDEEIKRDETFRQTLIQEKKPAASRANPPASIQIPNSNLDNGWNANEPTSASTLRVLSGSGLPLQTPGLAIGLATPSQVVPPAVPNSATGTLPTTVEEGSGLEKTVSQQSHGRPSTDRAGDYFSGAPVQQAATTPGAHTNGKPNESHEELPQSPSEEKEPHEEGGKTPTWGKKFKMSFGMKKLGKTATNEAKAPIVEEKAEDSDSRSSKTDERSFEDSFHGAIQRIRHGYEEQLQEGAESLTPAITPSLPNETPVLKPPLNTTILIQEDRPDSGGVADLFEGTVGSAGQQADIIEKVGPMWLAEVLLRNQIPPKDIVKVSFVLEPYHDELPSIASDGNNRLNANRMLRARKILAYVAERIEPMPENPDPNALKPEEYLELYCQDKLIPATMTLATIRAHVWRGGGDVLLHYKSNGRKQIKHAPKPAQGETEESTGIGEAPDAPRAEAA